MKIRGILAFLFISLFIFFPTHTSACSCAELPSALQELENSEAVFSGKVVAINESGARSKQVLFEVTNSWKGVEQTQIIINTGLGGGDCGIDFVEGVEYLVYANESTMYGKESLVSIICDRTNKLSSLQDDLIVLGEGNVPTEKVDLTSESDGISIYVWIFGVFLIGMVVFLIVKRGK